FKQRCVRNVYSQRRRERQQRLPSDDIDCRRSGEHFALQGLCCRWERGVPGWRGQQSNPRGERVSPAITTEHDRETCERSRRPLPPGRFRAGRFHFWSSFSTRATSSGTSTLTASCSTSATRIFHPFSSQRNCSSCSRRSSSPCGKVGYSSRASRWKTYSPRCFKCRA